MKQTYEEKMMRRALRLAQKAGEQNEVPVGAIVVDENGKVIGKGYNRRQTKQNVVEHAELMALQMACRHLHSWRLENCSLFVTLEPCVMCAGAIIQSRIKHVYYGAPDPKAGAVDSVTSLFSIPQWNHHPGWSGGILEEECSTILKDFFRRRREEKKQQKLQKRLLEQADVSETAASAQNQTEFEELHSICSCCSGEQTFSSYNQTEPAQAEISDRSENQIQQDFAELSSLPSNRIVQTDSSSEKGEL